MNSPIDSVKTALEYLAGFPRNDTVAQHYDDDPFFSQALIMLFPGFEYPDFSGRTVAQVLTLAK